MAFRALIADDAVECRDGLDPSCWLHPSQQAPKVSNFKFDLNLPVINLVKLSKLTLAAQDSEVAWCFYSACAHVTQGR